MKTAALLVALVLFPVYVHATPMLYTIEATPGSCQAPPGWNGPGSLPTDYRDFMHSQTITLTYLIDAPNWTTSQSELVSYSPNLIVDPHPGEIFTTSAGIDGGSGTADDPYIGKIYTRSAYNIIRISGPWSRTISGIEDKMDFDWQVGTEVGGFSYRDWAAGPMFGFEFNGTVVSISQVPEMELTILFVIAVLGYICMTHLRVLRRLNSNIG